MHTQVGDKISTTFPINYYLGNLEQKNMKNEGASYYYTLFKKYIGDQNFKVIYTII